MVTRTVPPAIAVLTGKRDHSTTQEWPGWRERDAAQPYPMERIDPVQPPLTPGPRGGGALWLALAIAGLRDPAFAARLSEGGLGMARARGWSGRARQFLALGWGAP